MANVKILVVEDESIVAMDIKHRAEGLGYTVTGITPSGEGAIEKASETLPDLVLMDIVLKGDMDGVEAAQKIRDTLDIPVVYLTAYSDEKTLKRAKVTEPFGYIIKPFEDRELHSAVEVALYKHKMESKLKESEKWLSTTLESIGDAVIATDENGSVKFMNPVAMKITGWDEVDAFGKSLNKVYHIIKEGSEAPVDDPVKEVVQKNQIIEFSEPTILITKEGKKVPIDDSSAPIRDKNGSIIGVALVFRDITERRKAEKEREELLKERARGELSNFVVSALPVFASNIPPQVRNNIAKSFADRFEGNMKPQFELEFAKCTGDIPNNSVLFNCYIEWLSDFLFNLGINTEKRAVDNKNYLKFQNCPWLAEAGKSPMFCLICRAMVIRSFTWTSIKGTVEQTSCMADGDGCYNFEFKFLKKNNET
ncbi:MAG TPA: methanogen output domain 1-containing protein [Methanobacterium sp.]